MPQFDVIFRGPDGARRRGTYEGDSLESVRDGLKQNGFDPIAYAAQGPPTPTSEGTVGGAAAGKLLGPTATGGAAAKEQSAEDAGLAAQMGTGFVSGPLPALAAGAIAPGVVRAAQGQLPTLSNTFGDVKRSAVNEALPKIVKGTIGTVGRTLAMIPGAAELPGQIAAPLARVGTRITEAMKTPVGVLADYFQVPLGAGERFAGSMAERLQHWAGKTPVLEAKQEEAVGEALLRTIRKSESVAQNPEKEAAQLLRSMRDVRDAAPTREAQRLYMEDVQAALTHDPDHVVNLDNVSNRYLRKMIRQDPNTVRNMLNRANDVLRQWKDVPQNLLGDPDREVARLFWSETLHGVSRATRAGEKGIFQTAEGFDELDMRRARDSWRGLDVIDKRAFGKTAPEIEKLMKVVDSIAPADRGKVPVGWFRQSLLLAAKRKNLAPLMLGIGAEELVGPKLLQHHPKLAAVTALTILAGKGGAQGLLRRFLSTEAGTRYVAFGLNMWKQGMPMTTIVDTLSRYGAGQAQGMGVSSPVAPQLPQLGGRTAYAQ